MADAVELDALWDFGDPGGSEERFRAFVEHARAGDEPILAETPTRLARAQGLQRQFEVADRTPDEAEAALRPDDNPGRIRLHLERGRSRTRPDGREEERSRSAGHGSSLGGRTRTASPSTRRTCSGSSSRPMRPGHGTSARWSSLAPPTTLLLAAGSARSALAAVSC